MEVIVVEIVFGHAAQTEADESAKLTKDQTSGKTTEK
jgi:hypothetical protein